VDEISIPKPVSTKVMLHTIKTKQLIKSDINSVWNFISSPSNLVIITPASMQFEIVGDANELGKMYAGQIIEYFVSPVAGIRMHWVTEITHVTKNEYFTDEQRMGPYRFWHHQHFLKEVEGGVEMTDIVHYKAPLGFLGDIVNALFVRKRLQGIFDYRFGKIEEIFNYEV
jgi:ligand-binding SRPBCC domain-containing protein